VGGLGEGGGTSFKEGFLPVLEAVQVQAHFVTHTRARITQIMNLSLLALGVQEELLHLPPSTGGRDPIREQMIHPITIVPDWDLSLSL